MSHILSQDEVDALLRGISGGEIETEVEDHRDPADVASYDLTNQDRIVRGRMPALEMANEKFTRIFRATLSSMLRKVVSVTALSVDIIKFGEFVKTLPVPTSLHLFRMEPLRGNAIFVLESKVIFTLVDVLFGGTGQGDYKIEGREFTAIENNLIGKIVKSAFSDLEKSWRTLIDLRVIYQRSEINPQFMKIVPASDMVLIINFEIEVENTSGVLSFCIPYSTLGPIRERLSAGFQNEQGEMDDGWIHRFRDGILNSKVDMLVELGRTEISAGDVIGLKKGDVIVLDQYASDALNIYIEGILKFKGYPGMCRGNQAVQVAQAGLNKEETGYGAE
ncbi:MAG: flagellar motor switch protein FliM [Deltaproteobacteria bacterium]|nr:flagellar motor switch protein FliM [Deltaproteobacteria bacterium]